MPTTYDPIHGYIDITEFTNIIDIHLGPKYDFSENLLTTRGDTFNMFCGSCVKYYVCSPVLQS